MPIKIRTRIEEEAMTAAAGLTGEYFDRIGKTDMALMSETEFHTTFAVFLEHFGKEMAERLAAANSAPF